MIKLFFSILAIVFCGGCISVNPCPYCGEKRDPDYYSVSYEKLDDDGLVKQTREMKWAHILREHKETHTQELK